VKLSGLVARARVAWHGGRRWHRLLVRCAGIVLFCLAGCDTGDTRQPVLLQKHAGLPVVSGEPIELSIPRAAGPVLVEVRGTGASLDTQVLSPRHDVLSRVHFEYLRSAPAYHVLAPADNSVGPILRIIPVQAAKGASVRVAFHRLPEADPGSGDLARAWRDFARGLQHVGTMDPADWGANLAALESAQDRFERLGHRRPALWAAFFRAYLLYFPLYRYEAASAGAHAVLDAVENTLAEGAADDSLATIAVLAHQLAGQILLESEARGSHAAGKRPLAAARDHFALAGRLAVEEGLAFEETWAVNNLGIAHFYEDQLDLALDHYTQALQRAEAEQDNYLVALVGSNIAVAQERLGRIDTAVRTLERLAREPALRNSAMEREHLLSLLGAFYLKLYRFPEALRALNEALSWSDRLESSENRGRNRVMLGRAYREMGQPDKALAFARLAIPDLQAVEDVRGLQQAHRLLAALHRLRGDFDAMEREREQQWESRPPRTDLDRADWLFSRAEDASARGETSAATKRFRESAEAYAAAGFTTMAGIARIHACAAGAGLESATDCSIESQRVLYREIEALQASAPALRARFAWVRLLAAEGRRDRALAEAEKLVDEVRFYRQTLPGVLGAWYWDARDSMLTFYLQLMLDGPAGLRSGRPDVLLTLDQLRNAGAAVGPAESSGADNSLRSLLAKRDGAGSPEALMEAQRLIDRDLAGRQPVAMPGGETDAAGLAAELARLPPDWSLIAYYLAGPTAFAWVADHDALEVIVLGPSEPILAQIERVKTGLRVHNEPTLEADLAELGRLLLQPVGDKLRFNVMLAAGGALSDLPLDAVPVDGRPFIENHQLMHIQSIRSAAGSVGRASAPLAPKRLFLAGDPNVGTQSLRALPGSRRELEALRTAFPSAESETFTGHSLTAAAFRDSGFASSDLVHLASHAVIDRDYPELSRLMVSGQDDDGAAFVTPSDLESINISARLVVLSACETVGLNRFDFDNRLGFVTQFLRQSEALVVASLWPVSDRVTAGLMADFYGELANTGDAPAALRAAKLRQRAAARPGDHSWAAFQLFSR
jgi:CHAT domain-containing protein/tetratricopeptide (TPR) repeat protein